MRPKLSHISGGKVRMVDVGDKPVTDRVAIARAFVRMNPSTLKLIKTNRLGKGNVLTTAQLAGIHAAKRTGEWIPLCHSIPLSFVGVEFRFSTRPSGIEIMATAMATAKTGVEMEALTAAGAAALTIYDMAKAVEKGMVIEKIRLMYKAGGKSGVWGGDR